MNGPFWQITATDDDGDGEYGKEVVSTNEDEVIESALNTSEADEGSGWTVTITEIGDEDEY